MNHPKLAFFCLIHRSTHFTHHLFTHTIGIYQELGKGQRLIQCPGGADCTYKPGGVWFRKSGKARLDELNNKTSNTAGAQTMEA